MAFELDFTANAKEDIEKHKKSGNKAVIKKLATLFNELTTDPFSGTGKPESLKYQLSGCWSRRINQEHRLVYQVKNNIVTVLSAFGHY